MAIRTFSDLHKKNFTILRLFNFYGEDMPKNFFIPQLIEKLKDNKDFDMTLGEQKRDFLHISDILEAMILATDTIAYNELFNVCSGQGKTIKEIALELKQLLNSQAKINFGALPYRENEVWEMVGDCSKLKNQLNFSINNWINYIL
jgi:nucleoside-diphosphate-sugar epimerase